MAFEFFHGKARPAIPEDSDGDTLRYNTRQYETIRDAAMQLDTSGASSSASVTPTSFSRPMSAGPLDQLGRSSMPVNGSTPITARRRLKVMPHQQSVNFRDTIISTASNFISMASCPPDLPSPEQSGDLKEETQGMTESISLSALSINSTQSDNLHVTTVLKSKLVIIMVGPRHLFGLGKPCRKPCVAVHVCMLRFAWEYGTTRLSNIVLTCRTSDQTSTWYQSCISQVGLPARGKTFLCNKLKSYLNWLGHVTGHFNVGQYRRTQKGAEEVQVGAEGVNPCSSQR